MAMYDVNALLTSTAYGSDGDKIGKVEQVFLDDNTEEVTFVTVNTGLFGTKESFVPVDGAQQDGDRIVLPYTKDVVKDAPNVDADQHLSPAEEEEIYRYYKMNYSGTDRDSGRDAHDTDRNAVPGGAAGSAGYPENDTDHPTGVAAGTRGYAETDRDRTDRNSTAGIADVDRGITDRDLTDRDRDRDLTDGDNDVVRHEERLHVGKEREATGRARLRKYVVTETQSVDVPLQREEVRVERTPLDGTEATSGTIDENDTAEVTLHEERPVVGKETVGVERVGLEKETVNETRSVDAEVRKEQVDVETDTDRRDGLADNDRRDRI